MKFNYAAVALFASVAMMCSESNGDLLSRMLGRGGCGDCQPTSCCDTPAPACGGRGFSISINMNIGRPGRLFRGCGSNTGGCGQVDSCGTIDNCGYGEVVDSCGGGVRSRLFSGGLLSRLGSCGGCGAPADLGCGCDAAPVVNHYQPACVEEVESCGGGLLAGRSLFSGRFLSRLRGIGANDCGCDTGLDMGCGCDAAPVAMPAPVIMSAPSCGCESVDACGCGGGLNLRGRVSGLFSRFGGGGCDTCGSTSACDCGTAYAPARRIGGRLSNLGGCGTCGATTIDCGCGTAAPVADCGCDHAPACGCNPGGRVKNLLGRIPRPFQGGCGATICDDGCGQPAYASNRVTLLDRVRAHHTSRIAVGCNNDCNVPCPNSGCSGCSGGMQTYAAPMQNENGGIMPPPADAQPAGEQPLEAAPESTEGSVIVPSADGAWNNRQPVVDPTAFVIRG